MLPQDENEEEPPEVQEINPDDINPYKIILKDKVLIKSVTKQVFETFD